MVQSLFAGVAFLLIYMCLQANAHIELKEPPPRHSQFSKFYMDNDDVDYNMKSPLGPIVGYPCRNFKAGPAQGTMVAGHPFHVRFDGVATHLGGDCQFAVSYDNGTTFAVIWDKISTCFLDTVDGGYDVPVPNTIPASKKAVFAWTWINGLGAREYYMNCADVRIENYGHQEPLTAHELLVVNLPGRLTVSPKTGREEDKLTPLMKQRPFVTIGKPTDLARDEDDSSGGEKARVGVDSNEPQPPGEPDPMSSQDPASNGNADNTMAEEITSFVFSTRTITEENDVADGVANLDAGFTYNEPDDYRGRVKKTGNGFTVLSDDNEISEYMGGYTKHSITDTSIPFNVDDTIPLATHHFVSSDYNFDLWPSSSDSTVASMSIDNEGAPQLHQSPNEAGAATVRGAGADLLDALSSTSSNTVADSAASTPSDTAIGVASEADMVTIVKTVTVSSKLYLQVVVSSNNTAVPSSLTIAY
ncbi:hypothetical protein IW140_000570 [Coemansia sp. RSA 1813]|nr:hypothetical protein EV178_002699 [Coemansia sp. RSA 1646]KAJ1774039.1 hypothetical protein LPJ74_000138 [Coemansia sp. RSA 1843]KAJ2092571.1 hypothetical protein IW138_001009 [Coemansia sp. RSA 986]KAJ2216735.1 hypothetical protein EV179_001025 [Coemansia sp. RSA 487]KAJ2572807.1 hypothetical protein IW140_000570 [Coemansia sp. RSA 1813]